MNAPHNERQTRIDGQAYDIPAGFADSLLQFLRVNVGVKAARAGCLNGDCGACTVLIDGAPYKACIVPAVRASGRQIETLAGLADGQELHAVQQHFWGTNAFQCGFCLAGQILCLVSLLREKPSASRTEIEDALAGNLCRCTGYQQMVEAALAVVAENVGARVDAEPAV